MAKKTICPRCSQGTLVVRVRKDNGQSFTGCSMFPKCYYSVQKNTRKSGIPYPPNRFEAGLDKDEYWELGEWDPSVYEV